MTVQGSDRAGNRNRILKVGVILPMFSGDPANVIGAAESAEALGFDGVFAFDHFFPPGAPADRPALEAFTTLGAVAARTDRVALGTLVTRAILRPVGLVAKMLATLDMMSGGRAILGVGTGDPIDRPEHRAFGFPDLSILERRAHLAETVAALKALFHGKTFAGGKHVPPIEGPLMPAVREGGPPLWLGAQSDEVVKLAAALADGWNGWGLSPGRFRAKADLLAAEAARAGRYAEATWAGIVLVGTDEREARKLLEDRERKGMSGGLAWVGPAESFVGHLQELSAAGASWAILVLAGPPDRRHLLSERILPALDASPASDRA
jgi:alkanesulfonate monooxygenase SsuD/methylene tetrahydromethanopterin reductase-like flavin-dependent oxidoreductase (luciferase family)